MITHQLGSPQKRGFKLSRRRFATVVMYFVVFYASQTFGHIQLAFLAKVRSTVKVYRLALKVAVADLVKFSVLVCTFPCVRIVTCTVKPRFKTFGSKKPTPWAGATQF